MSSLYYGCSPYQNQNSRKKSLFKRNSSKRRQFITVGNRRSLGNSGSLLNVGKMASKNIVFGLVKTGEAVKEGTATFQKAVEVAKNIKSGRIKYEIGPATMMFGLVLVSISVSLLYLAHYNSVATKGYDLRRLEADRQQLMTQYDIKNMKLAEAKSMATIIASDSIGSMRKPGNVEFVQGATAIASR